MHNYINPNSPQKPYNNNRKMSVYQCLSKCGLWTSSIHITWELMRNADSQAHPSPAEPEMDGWHPACLCFNKFSR